MTQVRDPAVAGSFYPSDSHELRTAIECMLGQVRPQPGPAPRALIVPHAGYVYSGPIAAAAYAQLVPHRELYRRVVLLGPAHRVSCRGMALPEADVFQTPLGAVPVDRTAINPIDHPAVAVFEATHRLEHSLEVQLPFLQIVLGSFRLVPLVVGDTAPEAVAKVVEASWDLPATLVVISSDLSHYLDYDESRARDRATCRAIEALDAGRIGHHDACGATPVNGLLIAARRCGMHVQTLDLRNSGDTAGGRDRVVGYGAWMVLDGETCAQAASLR